MKTVELTEKEYELLAYALGMAGGTAMKDNNPKLADRIKDLWYKIENSGGLATPMEDE